MTDPAPPLSFRQLSRISTGALVACTVFGGSAFAQSGGIEIFSGETLFGQGTRVSAAYLYDQGSRSYRGSDHVADPEQADRMRDRVVLGYN